MKANLRWLAALFTTVPLLSACTSARRFPADPELVTLLQQRIDQGRAVGIVVGLIELDGSSRTVVVGSAGAGARPLAEGTLFEIGSVTKVFTGTLLADMARRGEVSLSDPVARYLPEQVRVPSRAGREITLADLATHRSALPRLPTNMAPADGTNPYADYSVDQMYAFLSTYELPRDIGSQFEYSNLGVGLLGHALARAAGLPYETLLRQRILDPLGMHGTGIELTEPMQEWMARGHNDVGTPVPLWDLPTFAGAGALRSNVPDMLRFLKANIGEPQSDLERAMRDAHRAQPPDLSIGLNWIIRSADDSQILWHNGSTGGFTSFMGFDPDRQIGVVVLANSTHSVDDIGLHLLDPKLPLREPPRERVEIEVSAEILDDYVGSYRLSPDFAIEVTLENGALFVQATNQPRLPIFPESDTEFLSPSRRCADHVRARGERHGDWSHSPPGRPGSAWTEDRVVRPPDRNIHRPFPAVGVTVPPQRERYAADLFRTPRSRLRGCRDRPPTYDAFGAVAARSSRCDAPLSRGQRRISRPCLPTRPRRHGGVATGNHDQGAA
jgi:D-alanyl-D-alanine-carboxypeptidase/D-alanyl-D-alanine-endopeptidase